MSRRERKRLIRRNSILELAEPMFIKKGFDETSMDQIAFEAGLTKATVYNYFESKDDILAAVLSRNYERMYKTFSSSIKESPGELISIGKAYLSFIDTYPKQAEMLDSGKCVTINRRIIEKEDQGLKLTKSETEFRENESRVGHLMVGVIQRIMGEKETPPLKVVKVLGSIYPMIRSIVRQGRMAGQQEEEIKDSLMVLFRIIEQGIMHFE